MNRIARAALFGLGTMLAAACAQEAQDSAKPTHLGYVSATDLAAPRPRGSYVMTTPAPDAPRFGPGPLHRILFMNRNGGTFTEGWDNSSTNTSIIPNGSGTVSAWSYGDAAWTQLMTCVREMYAAFDIEVTDVDPGGTQHIESVVGGSPGQVGQPSYVGGVAPVNNDCSVVERGIVYTFAAVYGGDVQSICETVAQESAHALGLDHEYLCQDPMTYLYGCGAKSFQDTAASCGENGPRTCMCGGSTQNSVQILLDVLGPAVGGGDTTLPAVDITSPANGATVSPGFAVTAIASDNVGVIRVDLYIDGSSFSSDTAGPWEFTTPALAAGSHSLEVRAYDAAGNLATDGISVIVQDDPGSCGTCPAGTHCEIDVCVADGIDPGDLGSPCAENGDCASGLCGFDGAERLCTESCTAGSCPSGFDCLASSSGGVCWPSAVDPGAQPGAIIGGCSTASGAAPGRGGVAPALLLLGLALALVYVLRQRA